MLGSRTDSLATHPGQILGTPDYMAPEQLSDDDVGPYSDVYAFGVVAYEMLCGRRPFPPDGMAKVIVQKLTEAPVRPTEIAPELDPRWEELVLSCLEREPRERLAGPQEILRLLDQLARDEPVGRISSSTRALWRRRPAAAVSFGPPRSQRPRPPRQSQPINRPASAPKCARCFPARPGSAICPRTRTWRSCPSPSKPKTPEDEALANGLLSFLHRSFFELYPDKAEMCVHIRGGRRSATTYGAQLALTGELELDGDSLRLESRIEDASKDAENPEGPRRLVRFASVSDERSNTPAFVQSALVELARELELEYPEEQWAAWRGRLPQDDVRATGRLSARRGASGGRAIRRRRRGRAGADSRGRGIQRRRRPQLRLRPGPRRPRRRLPHALRKARRAKLGCKGAQRLPRGRRPQTRA